MCHQQQCQSGSAGGLVGPTDIVQQWCHHFPSEGWRGWEVGGWENIQISKTVWQRAKELVHGMHPKSKHRPYSWLNSMSSFLTKQTSKLMSQAGLVKFKLKEDSWQRREECESLFKLSEGLKIKGMLQMNHRCVVWPHLKEKVWTHVLNHHTWRQSKKTASLISL